MTCCHCGGDLLAERHGDGVRVDFGREPTVALTARCPYPRCARVVCARATADGDFELTSVNELVRWSPAALVSAASSWLWLCGLIAGFATIPAIGLHEAFDSLLCGGVAWLLFAGGSLLALVPVIYFIRGLACAAHDAVRLAARARDTIREGAAGGLRLAPDPRTYRSH